MEPTFSKADPTITTWDNLKFKINPREGIVIAPAPEMKFMVEITYNKRRWPKNKPKVRTYTASGQPMTQTAHPNFYHTPSKTTIEITTRDPPQFRFIPPTKFAHPDDSYRFGASVNQGPTTMIPDEFIAPQDQQDAQNEEVLNESRRLRKLVQQKLRRKIAARTKPYSNSNSSNSNGQSSNEEWQEHTTETESETSQAQVNSHIRQQQQQQQSQWQQELINSVIEMEEAVEARRSDPRSQILHLQQHQPLRQQKPFKSAAAVSGQQQVSLLRPLGAAYPLD